MEGLRRVIHLPEEHILSIFNSFDASPRVLESFTNLSNTVIDTALSGQSKFVFEILQNADDSCDDQTRDITVQFILEDDYFIVQHNGKAFDFYDVERICDYASQIKEVKATDLNKTGYKGLGFKSLFNLSKCIYIYSGGYSFRFDMSFWPNPGSKPWQVIPIWSNDLPLSEKYTYDESVNFILKIKKSKKQKLQLEQQLKEILDRPDFFLYLHHVNKFRINLFGEEKVLERKLVNFGEFVKCNFYKNQSIVSTWLSRTFELAVSTKVKRSIQKGSEHTYPDKIKNATHVPITFTLKIDESGKEITKINGLCFSTLPTQLDLALPYHFNSFFILNLDRTQLDENDFNKFLIEHVGYLQLNFLKDLAKVTYLKNFVIELFTPSIKHPYANFNEAFSRGFSRAKSNIAWLPAQEGAHLLKLSEAWIDEILFFKQNFKDIQDDISRNIIDYNVTKQYLLANEINCFTYIQLFKDFPDKYHPLLTDDSYVNFLSYLYKRLKICAFNSVVVCKLKDVTFLRTKSGTLSSPKNALLEEINNTIPHCFGLNPIDNRFLQSTCGDSLREWLISLGAKRMTPIQIIRESLLKWIDFRSLDSKLNTKNHIEIINYLAENAELLTKEENKKLKEHLLVFTESKKFKLMKTCFLPEAFPVKELEDVVSRDEKILPVYNMNSLKKFLTMLAMNNKLTPLNLFRKGILAWIKNNEMKSKLTLKNYNPIVEYLASEYLKIEEKLTESERSEMKNMPVLTCAQIFQKAEVCYFNSAVPDITGFESEFAKDILVCSKNISRNVHEFLAKLGVSKEIEPVTVLRKTVLKWIREGTVKNKISINNHKHILNYIADKWEIFLFSGLEQYERKHFGHFPILTKSNTFKEACHCYWQTESEKIPHIESIISSNDFVSLEYSSSRIKELLNSAYFGVRSLTFIDVCEEYCNHLNDRENIKWFFSNLIYYWENKSLKIRDGLIASIKKKLHTSYLVAKNGLVYRPAELYSARFSNIHSIDPSSLPLLDFCKMPEDLEKFLGFKGELEMPCVVKLLEAFGKKQKNRAMDEKKTFSFFSTILEQLRFKDANEIKRYNLKLLSKANELKPAKDLNYFSEENAKCTVDELYLKRVCGMSHNDTLELAKLSGVSIHQFRKNACFERQKYLSALKEFYLERLPFIVLRESKERNDHHLATLKNLYSSVCSIELFECKAICIKYPFGEPVKERHYFDDLKLYVIEKWRDHSSHIHKHIKEKLCLKADVDDIIDIQSVSQKKKEEWLHYEKENPQTFQQIEVEMLNLLSEQKNKRTTDEPSCNSEDMETVANPFKESPDGDSTQAATFGNDLTQRLEQEEKRNFHEQPSDITVHENVKESLLSKVYFNSTLMQSTCDALLKNSGERNLKIFTDQPSYSKSNEDISDYSPQKIDDKSGQEMYSNTLRDIYFEKLPFIVIRESREINQSPFVILKRLYNKISSIELFQYGSIKRGESCDMSFKVIPYFDGLSVYVPGIWTEYKSEIHEHIIQELRLNCYVADIINMESITKKKKKKWIRFRKENAKLFQQIGEELQKLLQDQTKLIHDDLETDVSNEFDAFVDERLKANNVPDYEFLDKNIRETSTEATDHGQHSINPDSVISEVSFKYPRRRVTLKIERTPNRNLDKTSSEDESDVDGNGLNLEAPQIQPRRKIIEETVFKEITTAEWPSLKTDQSHIQRVSESYVFTSLQDYYKSKYPKARCSVIDNCFRLKWQSHTIDISWLNESEDKKLWYDLTLKKDGEITQLIEVQSINKETNDSFSVNCRLFLRSNEQLVEKKLDKEKFRIYCVLYTDNSIPNIEQINGLSSLYKIVPLKLT